MYVGPNSASKFVTLIYISDRDKDRRSAIPKDVPIVELSPSSFSVNEFENFPLSGL